MSRSLSLLLCLLVACGGDPPVTTPPDAGMPQTQTYAARGLYTNPNNLSEVPDGAFSRADDAVIRRDGIVETRRGFAPASGTVGASGDRFRSLSDFAGTLVGHTSAGTLARFDGSAWTAYSGTYTAPDSRRMRFLQTGKSLYFTTSAGVYRLDETTGTPMAAGVPQAVTGTVALTGASGFLADNSQTAYRFVWGYRNANNRVILGTPSGRMPLANSAGGTRNVSVTVPVPSWVTADHFLQVYRADASASSTIPASDDMQLVNERYPTASELSARSLSFTDVMTDDLKGAALYSSPNLGVPGSEKFQPPVCTDLAEYKERMWCAATVQRQRVLLALLSADPASGGMADGDFINFVASDGTVYGFEAATAENAALRRFQRYTAGSAAQNIADTIQSLVRVVNASGVPFSAFYASGEYDNPGQVIVEATDLGAGAFTVIGTYGGPYWAPAIPWNFESTQLARVGSTVTVTVSLAHRLAVGQTVRLFDDASIPDFPGGVKTVASVPSSTTFTYTEAGAAVVDNVNFRTWETVTDSVTSDPSDAPNGIAYSEYGEQDSFPLGNYLAAGSPNYKVLRIIPLGSTLFIFKEDGLYVLTGDSPETFNINPFPLAVKLLAPDTAVVLGGAIYALTDQGVVAITESGFQVISRPIESDIVGLYDGNAATLAKVKELAFAVGYETEREYHLWLPSDYTSTYATQAYVYNYATKAWTRWTVDATAGHVLPSDGLEYLGRADSNGVAQERKTRTDADYQDATDTIIMMYVDWAVKTGENPGAVKHWQKATVMAEMPAPTSVTLSVGSELSSSRASGSFTFDGLPYVQTYIPEDQSRSQVLTVGVQGGEAGKRLAIKGLSVDFEYTTTSLR